MIKRIIGVVFVIAVVAVIAFTAIGAGSYNSMLSEDLFDWGIKASEVVPTEEQPSIEEVESADTLAADVVETELQAENEPQADGDAHVE